MFRFRFYCSATLLAVATAAAPVPNPLIAPGRSLGNVRLGAPADSLAALGPASTGDAAMQKAWATWYSRPARPGATPYQLDVYTVGEGPDLHKVVRTVRATSPWFHTAGGLRVGSTLAAARKSCGPVVLAATYKAPTGPRYLYDNAREGIAFETDGNAVTSHCTAVVIHPRGQPVTATYLSMTEYLKQLRPPVGKQTLAGGKLVSQ